MTLFEDHEFDDSYTVSGLGAAIASAVRRALPGEVWVRGEIRDLTRARSGHVYFKLVEAGDGNQPGGSVSASISVMLSARNKTSVNQTLKAAGAGRLDAGTQVKIRGRIDWYGPRGQIQLLMTAVDPIYTLGQLAAQRAAIVDGLRADGVFDANRRLTMPLLPLTVGLVTSLGSDAEKDVLDELTRSGLGFMVRCFDARVQGETAPATLAGGIAALDGLVDVIVLARGGGGATDLAAFDTDRVARAVCLARVPVVTGIGHEADVSVADEVAHEHHKTPTAAAQALVARVRHVHERVESTWQGICEVAGRRLVTEHDRAERTATGVAAAARTASARQAHRIERAGDRLVRASSGALGHASQGLEVCAAQVVATSRATAADQSRRLADHAARLGRAAPRVLRLADDDLHRLGRELARQSRAGLLEAARRIDAAETRRRLLDPAATLARGWSITRRADGSLVRRAGDASAGETLITMLTDGELTSRVESAGPEPPA